MVCGLLSELNQHQQALQPRNTNPDEIISFFTEKALRLIEKLYIPFGDSTIHKNATVLREFVVTLSTFTKKVPSPLPTPPLPAYSEEHVIFIKHYYISGSSLRDLQALSRLIISPVRAFVLAIVPVVRGRAEKGATTSQEWWDLNVNSG